MYFVFLINCTFLKVSDVCSNILLEVRAKFLLVVSFYSPYSLFALLLSYTRMFFKTLNIMLQNYFSVSVNLSHSYSFELSTTPSNTSQASSHFPISLFGWFLLSENSKVNYCFEKPIIQCMMWTEMKNHTNSILYFILSKYVFWKYTIISRETDGFQHSSTAKSEIVTAIYSNNFFLIILHFIDYLLCNNYFYLKRYFYTQINNQKCAL